MYAKRAKQETNKIKRRDFLCFYQMGKSFADLFSSKKAIFLSQPNGIVIY
jgi:hypothetical protein